MELDEYIEKSLVAISKGVTEAQSKAAVTIAPSGIEGKLNFEPQFVKFEIEVTTSAEGGGGIKVLTFGDASAKASSGRAHRLSFEVPVHFNSTNVFLKSSTPDAKKQK